MDRDAHSPGVLVSESHASARRQSGEESSRSRTVHRRKGFYLLDSLNVGGTEVQAVELATRLNPELYDVTPGCLRGPLLESLLGSPVAILEFYPKGGFDSVHGIYQMLRLARFLRRGRFQIVHIEKTDQMYTELLQSRGVE